MYFHREQHFSYLNVALKPNGRKNAILGIKEGKVVISVTALPSENQANKALLNFLAKTLRFPKSAATIIQGQRSREKRIAIQLTETQFQRSKNCLAYLLGPSS